MRAISHLAAKREFTFLKDKEEISASVVLVDGELSRKLNKRFRAKDRATNVLSFPVFDSLQSIKKAKQASLELGDVVIAPAIVRREARAAGRPFYAQFCWMLAHGILHILGFDHERTRGERRIMEKLESDLLSNLAIGAK